MITLLLFAAASAAPTDVASRIDDVTLYANTALVVRHAQVTGSGTFAITGLPWSLDPENVRVKCAGGDVLGVEQRVRQQARVPDERLQSLRDTAATLTREKQALEDERALRASELEHLQRLLRLETAPRDTQAAPTRATSSWNAHWQFVSEELARNAKAARDVQTRLDEKSRALAAVQQELGELQAAGTVPQRDVVVDVRANGAATLEIGYFVPDAGWQPAYDVRAAADLSKASLSYRARVWQQSGEDWNDVRVALSTAQPQRGAQGPDPEPVWLTIVDPRPTRATKARGDAAAPATEMADFDDEQEDKKFKSTAALRPFASVKSEGLSVRFELPQAATILSRATPTTVLVGAAELAIAAERHCVPALDPTVWLRARATNTSAWVLLPGRAAVFFGSDYFGEAEIGAISPGQEFTLHLGADPALSVKRETVEDLKKEAGLFSSRASKIDSWRVHVENHGAVTANADGSVDVIVRETLPKARDERVDVKLSKATPAPSDAERWKQDRAEKGFVTWVLRVPKSGATDLVWQTTITYPQDLELVRN